jgi:hypothetical protein
MGPAGDTFRGPLGETSVSVRNYYLTGFFPERGLVLGGSLVTITLMVVALAEVVR